MPSRRSDRGRAMANAIRQQGAEPFEVLTGIPTSRESAMMMGASALPVIGAPMRFAKAIRKVDDVKRRLYSAGRGPTKKDVSEALEYLEGPKKDEFIQELYDAGRGDLLEP